MQHPKFILTSQPQPLATAQILADNLDAVLHIDILAVSVAETDEARELWQVIAYLQSKNDAQALLQYLGTETATISALPQADWVRESLQGLSPVTAGRFFLHGSHDRHRRRSGGISLELDAQTAFGTGHHGTTFGCLAAFDGIAKHTRPRHILDLGCGTGILAIAAAKLHPPHIVASDIDAAAVATTRANAKINRVAQNFHAVCATGLNHPAITQGAPYDVIFANILAGPLANMALGLTRALAPGGHLILSGLTANQLGWIRARFNSQGLATAGVGVRENWATLVLQKKKKPGVFPCRARFG